MSFLTKAAAAGVLSLAAISYASFANAAELPVKAAKPVKDLPFFLVIDDRMTYSWQPNATDPGAFSLKPNGGGFNGNTSKQLISFTHFDVWQYGTNFFTISGIKSDHNDPAAPCAGATLNSTQNSATVNGFNTVCAGATEFYGLFRSTLGWNELFGTKQFTMGPLHNISFSWGADYETENSFLAPAKRDVVAGLQFAFDLPYKGYINVTPEAYKEINHNAFDSCGGGQTPGTSPGIPGVTCLVDGNTKFHTTWAVEMNYYMDLGFIPEPYQFFSISGRAGFFGPKGDSNAPLNTNTPSKTEINSEPIRLTFDASKAVWGPKYSHFVDVWVGYRYWQNKFGLDHNGANFVCTVNGVSTHSCTEQTVNTGITVKF